MWEAPAKTTINASIDGTIIFIFIISYPQYLRKIVTEHSISYIFRNASIIFVLFIFFYKFTVKMNILRSIIIN